MDTLSARRATKRSRFWVGVGGEQGALLVRNAWGPGWADKGYAWLPYRWVESRLACDFWTIVRVDFVNTDLFN